MWEGAIVLIFIAGFLLAWYLAQRGDRIHHERKMAILRERMDKTEKNKQREDDSTPSRREGD